MGHSSLLFPRILRLAGTALVIGFFVALVSTSLLSYDTAPSPESTRLFVISIILTIAFAILGFPLVMIGEAVSPPDPWLDPLLNPFRRGKSHPKEEAKED